MKFIDCKADKLYTKEVQGIRYKNLVTARGLFKEFSVHYTRTHTWLGLYQIEISLNRNLHLKLER